MNIFMLSLVIAKLDYISSDLGVISMYFRIFLKVKEQNGNIFEGVNI